MADWKAPDGDDLRGILQEDAGTWSIYWPDAATAVDEFDYEAAGPGSEWESVTYGGFGVFESDSLDQWFEHHLIPAGAEPLSEAACGAARNEVEHRKRADLYLQIAETYASDAPGRKETLRQRDIELAAARAMHRQFLEAKGAA
jgi:hypothetical protein